MGRLTALVLGSAAGGGFPQWNCRCATCRLAWAGDARVRPRTQASLAVSADGENWLLINASPDLPQQVRQSKVLHPRSGTRGSPIKAVVLTGAEIDQVAGLLSLREREPFMVCATPATLAALADNAMFGVLAADVVRRMAAIPGIPLMLPGEVEARLVHNEAQGGWVLLAPERVFKADAIAAEIIKRCTGEATFSELIDDLAKAYTAPREKILADVGALLRGLADKKLLEL